VKLKKVQMEQKKAILHTRAAMWKSLSRDLMKVKSLSKLKERLSRFMQDKFFEFHRNH